MIPKKSTKENTIAISEIEKHVTAQPAVKDSLLEDSLNIMKAHANRIKEHHKKMEDEGALPQFPQRDVHVFPGQDAHVLRLFIFSPCICIYKCVCVCACVCTYKKNGA